MIFGRKKQETFEKSVGVYLYPERIIIVTKYQRDASTSYLSDDISILTADASNYEVGDSLIKHLQRSKLDSGSYQNFQLYRKAFRKKGKFTSEKQVMINAKYVNVFMTNDTLRFEPFRNMFLERGWKEFFRIPESIFNCNSTMDFDMIGEQLRIAGDKAI